MSDLDGLKEFFLAVAKEAEDPAWQSLFESIANKNLPPCFDVKEGYMIYKYAKKFQRIEIPGDVKQAFLLLHNFILVNGGPISSQDSVVKVASKPLSWARIKNNSKRLNTYVRLYSHAVASYYGLSQERQERLYLFLVTSIRSGLISDVKIDEHSIVAIPQLVYDNTRGIFCLTKTSSCSTSRKPTITKKVHRSKWKNFSEDMNILKADIITHVVKANR